ncbi:MAG: ComEC/Rec2 family competence protein, partial [Patescibacteria group bacterium]
MVPEFAALRSSISTTLAAYAFTLPVISYYFGTISVSAIPANVLIGPAVTWIFVAGGVGALIGLLAPSIAYLALSPAYFVSAYVLFVVDVLSRVPYASLSWHMSTLWWSIPYYTLLLLFIHKNSTTDRYFRVKSES